MLAIGAITVGESIPAGDSEWTRVYRLAPEYKHNVEMYKAVWDSLPERMEDSDLPPSVVYVRFPAAVRRWDGNLEDQVLKAVGAGWSA